MVRENFDGLVTPENPKEKLGKLFQDVFASFEKRKLQYDTLTEKVKSLKAKLEGLIDIALNKPEFNSALRILLNYLKNVNDIEVYIAERKGEINSNEAGLRKIDKTFATHPDKIEIFILGAEKELKALLSDGIKSTDGYVKTTERSLETLSETINQFQVKLESL